VSDVPELDKLLDEHKIFKTNIAWDRRERLWLALMRIALVVVGVTVTCLLCGVYGVAVLPALLYFVKTFIPNPAWRDPFQRYNYM
jgi:hypothetical protein